MRKPPTKTKRRFLPPFMVRVKADQDKKLRAIAEAEGCSRAKVIRMAIDRFTSEYNFEVSQ